MEKLYVRNNRHVFAVTGPEVNGNVPVRYLGLSPSIVGSARRGRPPKVESLPLAQLTEVTDATTLAQLAELVNK